MRKKREAVPKVITITFGTASFYKNENPRLGLGFQKAYSVVLKKLFRRCYNIFGSPTKIRAYGGVFLCQKTLIV